MKKINIQSKTIEFALGKKTVSAHWRLIIVTFKFFTVELWPFLIHTELKTIQNKCWTNINIKTTIRVGFFLLKMFVSPTSWNPDSQKEKWFTYELKSKIWVPVLIEIQQKDQNLKLGNDTLPWVFIFYTDINRKAITSNLPRFAKQQMEIVVFRLSNWHNRWIKWTKERRSLGYDQENLHINWGIKLLFWGRWYVTTVERLLRKTLTVNVELEYLVLCLVNNEWKKTPIVHQWIWTIADN